MGRIYLLLLVFVSTIALTAFATTDGKSRHPQEHSEWVATSLKEIETIKVGMTREKLLKVFREEGGISTRKHRQYVYRECCYIKVEVEFEPVGEHIGPNSTENHEDKITKISRPFLEWPITD